MVVVGGADAWQYQSSLCRDGFKNYLYSCVLFVENSKKADFLFISGWIEAIGALLAFKKKND